jgi:hypothetical protein
MKREAARKYHRVRNEKRWKIVRSEFISDSTKGREKKKDNLVITLIILALMSVLCGFNYVASSTVVGIEQS